ncbi:unnamed protein product [Brassica rapa]|uniref:Uncharacterized protein n=1 Tax=Brassica campestris TaxID=3711 RepID=A0A8D9LZF0_BRACM|nr:unnamed protein product [Brassica rapa]
MRNLIKQLHAYSGESQLKEIYVYFDITFTATNCNYLTPPNKSAFNSPHPSSYSIIMMPSQAKNPLLRSSNPFLTLWQIKQQSLPLKLLLHFSSVRFHQDLEIPSCFLSKSISVKLAIISKKASFSALRC